MPIHCNLPLFCDSCDHEFLNSTVQNCPLCGDTGRPPTLSDYELKEWTKIMDDMIAIEKKNNVNFQEFQEFQDFQDELARLLDNTCWFSFTKLVIHMCYNDAVKHTQKSCIIDVLEYWYGALDSLPDDYEDQM